MHPTPARAASLSSSAAGRIARLWRAHAAFLVTAAVLLALILGLTSMAEEVYEIATEEDGVVGVDRPALDAATGMRGPVRRRWLAVVAVAAALYAVVMGLSRVYLGAHWLSDVMAGWAVGLAWALAVVLAHRVWLTLHRR